MRQLVYPETEILREHDYASPHVAAGYRLHGGFDAEGGYLSPRSAVRPDAVRAWQERLVEKPHRAFGKPFDGKEQVLQRYTPHSWT